MHESSAESQFFDAIRSKWRDHALSPEVSVALHTAMANGERDAANEPSPPTDLNFRVKDWVIRNEDLPIVEAIGVVGSVATAAVGTGVSAPVIASAVAAFAALAWKTWRKGGNLKADEVKLLGLLEIRGPSTLDELRKDAKRVGLAEDKVERLLTNLGQVEQNNGAVVAFVAMQPDGNWKARPI